MEKEFKDLKNQDDQCEGFVYNHEDDAFGAEKALFSFCRSEINEAPYLLRKSVERFLIGNVI